MADYRGGFHPLFIPMLLAITGNGDDVEKKLEDLMNFIQTTQAAVQSLRSGMETFHAGFSKINQSSAPHFKPAGPEPAKTTVNKPAAPEEEKDKFKENDNDKADTD
ncbi:hypothetical protein [Desulfocucumis palustris]|uniref:hypothetical protein n=1 Tax=Desulfocucumis palustris TaxID=1898651 RepID=UPI000CEA2334|nr:hypothetical protein [Desulfocucumis palustris]